MIDCISRAKLTALFNRWHDELNRKIEETIGFPTTRYGYKICRTQLEDCMNAVEDFPAADVRPVPKGQWVSFDAESEKCSHCKRRYYISALFAVGGNNEPDFCPGCGAYMGGDACAE